MATRPGATAGSRETFGGWNDQHPRKFLRNLQCQMLLSGITAPDAKAEFFMLCLDVDSPADAWHQALDPMIRTNWDKLEAEFMKEWAPPQQATRSDMEKTTELLNHKLKPEDVGTMVLFRGAMHHAHIAWASQIMIRVRDCGLETRAEYIHQVKGELPSSIISSMDQAYTDWRTFIDAVMGINVDQLKEKVRMERELSKAMEMFCELDARIKKLEADCASDFQWQQTPGRNRKKLPNRQQPAAHWHSRADEMVVRYS
jgi:hypothetical protein